MQRSLAAAIWLLFVGAPLLAHPGGLAADGCHTDHKNGGRHCHRGSSTASRSPKPQRALGGAAYFANCTAARAAGAAPSVAAILATRGISIATATGSGASDAPQSRGQPGRDAPTAYSVGDGRASDGIAEPVTRDHELWGVALWLEKAHGDRGAEHIAKEVTRLAADGDTDGVAMWRSVAERYDRLRHQSSIH